MALTLARVVLLLFCSGYQFRGGAGLSPFIGDPEKEWDRVAKLTETIGPETKLFKSASGDQSLVSQPKTVPEYVIVSSVEDPMELLKPEKTMQHFPDRIKIILQRPSPSSNVKPTRTPLVEILCHLDRIYTRIRRSVFPNRYAYKDLKLGSCPVNQCSKVHYYFLYSLTTNCGFNNEKFTDYSSIRNTLRYNPAGPVLRAMPFNVLLQCKYYRFFHAYRVGFHPKLQGGTVFKALTKSGFTLTPQDASGNPITGTSTYTLGQPMYFEAKRPKGTTSPDKRVYINKCVMTASLDPNSTPQHTVINNQGCMLESKFNPRAKFLTGMSTMAQRFTVGALLFKDAVSTSSSQQLYMHCDISLGNRSPTQSSKACTYDPTIKTWKELYGGNDVCACCDSTCATVRASKNMVSSHSWKVDMSNKDGYDKINNWMKLLVDEPFSPEDPAKTD